jgi:hypothetical protein
MTDPVSRYLSTWQGNRLLEKHSLDDEGVWRVRGEDPNPDMGGHHHQPELGIFEGRLGDVIGYAVHLPNFWTWGGGGSIDRHVPKRVMKITALSVREFEEKRERIRALEAEKSRIEREIASIKNEVGE